MCLPLMFHEQENNSNLHAHSCFNYKLTSRVHNTVCILNFVGKIFVVCQKSQFVSVLNFVGINFTGN